METRGKSGDTNFSPRDDLHQADRSRISPPQPDQMSREHLSYLRLFFLLVASIFLAEVVAMGLIYILPPLPYQYTTLIDAGVMTILIFPVLYLLSFRPLIRHIYRRYWVEQALLKQKELEERFFNSIDLLIVYMDCDFNYIHVNDDYAREIGQIPDYFVGKNFFTLFPHPETEHLFRQVLVTGKPCSSYEDAFESLQDRGHEPRYWDWSLQPVKGSNGIVDGLVLSLLDVTQRKRAADSVQQLSRIVEQTEDTVVVTDCSGVIEYVNPSFERMTGFTRQEVVGRTPRLLKSGYHDQDFYRVLWDTVLRGDVYQSEICNRKKNGELFHEVKTITPLRNASGDITHFVATGKDITRHKQDEEKLREAYDELELRVQERTEELRIANAELEDEIQVRRQAEEALRQSEQRLNRAQEIAHLGSWELDLGLNRLTWSDEVYRIFGLQPGEFNATYEAFLEMVHPEDRALVNEAYAVSVREGRDAYEVEHRIVKHATGEVRLVHEKCEHVRDESGRIIRSVGMVHDVTERKQAEEALREAAERFRIVAEFTHDWEYWRSPENRFHYIAPSCQRITGYSREDFINDPDLFLQIVHPEDRERLAAHYAEDLLEQDEYEIEFRIIRQDGQERWLGHVCRPVLDHEGRLLGRRASNRDITERKQAEAALRRAHDELEQRVLERTMELASANQDLVREVSERKEIERQLRLQTTAMEAAANGILISDVRGNIQWANPALARISGYATSELIGQHTRVFQGGQHDTNFYGQMWQTIHAGQVWMGETINRRKDGTLYVEEQTITPVHGDHGQVTHFIAVKQDITERKQAEEKLAQRNIELQIISTAERNQRQFSEALIQAALILNRSLKLDEVLTLILQQIKGTIPFQLANILFIDGDSFYDASHLGDLAWPVTPEHTEDRLQLQSFPLLHRIYQSGIPVLVADAYEEPDWIKLQSFEWVRSLLAAPLLVEGRVIGVVNLLSIQPGFFTEAMRDRLVAFAAHAAVAIQNAWLFEQVRASTERLQSLSRRLVEIQENERLHISRELHDEAGQVLTSLLVDLRLLEQHSSQPEIILKIVSEMEQSLNDVIENLHRMAMALRPASLDHVGLVAALRQHVEAVGDKHGIQAHFRSSGVIERLPANVETILYRTVQEALTNVVRHARATRVDVVLMVRDGKLVVLVEDDGVGFDPQSVSSDDHLGLFGIRERAEMIGAALEVESEPGKGTTIILEVEYADSITGRR